MQKLKSEDKHSYSSMADPGGQFGATSPPNGCGAPLKWRPFLVPIEVEKKTKLLSLK